MKQKKYFPVFLVLLSVFIVLVVYSQNTSEVKFLEIIRPVLVLCVLFMGLFLLVKKITGNFLRSSVLIFVLSLLFFTYGHFYEFLKTHPVLGVNLGRHLILGAIWVVLMMFSIVFFLGRKRRIHLLVPYYLNLVIGILVVGAVFRSIFPLLQNRSQSQQTRKQGESAQDLWLSENAQALSPDPSQPLPDIYYIIPDMFARSDVIEDYTGFDNRNFLNSLRSMGFYIADCSRSNYASTQLSIASSLNAHYLDQIQAGLEDRSMLVEPLTNSLVRTSLESLGYLTVVFDNGFGLDEIKQPNLDIKPSTPFLLFRPVSPFEILIVKGSFLRIGYDLNLGIFSRFYDTIFFPYHSHVIAQRNIFNQLPVLPETEKPKFVFAHIMAPHPPFLFREDGSIEKNSDYYREALGQPVTQELFIEGYKRQVIFVEEQLLVVVQEILEKSEVEPIIIIQGDHGIDGSSRMDILNAYYVPDEVREQLYSTITPVNSFRVLFNELFQTQYELLPDRSWYSRYPNWFKIKLAAETNPDCINQK